MNKKEEYFQKKVMEVAYRDYRSGLNRYSLLKLHERTLSEDTVQDTFIKTWSYMVKGGKILVMKSFLYHILNDLIIDEYRKKRSVSLDALIDKGFDPKDKNPERNVNVLDGKKAIELIKKLPEKYQKIMRMKYIQELSLKEMSILTGQTKNTLAVQIHRGIEKLKVLYKHTS